METVAPAQRSEPAGPSSESGPAAVPIVDVDVVVVNHSSGPKTLELLGDLAACRPTVRHVVVVDNGPVPFEGDAAARPFPVEVIRTANRGFGAAVNDGVRACGSSIVCISNPDLRLRDLRVMGVLAEALGDASIGIAAPVATDAGGTRVVDGHAELPSLTASLRIAWSRLRHAPAMVPTGDVDNVTGAFMMMRRSVWDRVGGFDEGYFMYFEDADLCTRVRRMGLRICMLPGATVEHEVGGTPASWPQRRAWYRAGRRRYFSTWRPLHERVAVTVLSALTDRRRGGHH